MALFSHKQTAGTGYSYSLWPVLLVLLLAVLVPAGCVLWFMTAAMRSESLAVRQRLSDVYHENMLAAKKDLDEAWERQWKALGQIQPDLLPQGVFASLVRRHVVDSVIVLDRKVYPSDPVADGEDLPEGDALWDKAAQLELQDGGLADAAKAFGEFAAATESANSRELALQAQARCLLRLGSKQEALRVLSGLLARDNLRQAVDASGRLIVPAAQLLALQLIGQASDARFGEVRDRLVERLNDYTVPMPAAQRRFLMHALVEMGQSPKGATGGLPASASSQHGQTNCPQYPDWDRFLAAEDLAAEYLAVDQPRPEPGHLSKTRTPGVWHIASAGRIALYRQQWIIDWLESVLDKQKSAGMSLVLRPAAEGQMPGPQPFLSMWATDYLPGWTLEARLTGPDPFAAAAGRQRAVYLWTGGLGVVLIAVLAAMVAGFIGRQMRLTRLKNDLIATVSHELKTPLASMRMLVDTLLEGRYRDQRQVTEYLQLIGKENQRLSRLIDNFLTFSRMERNKRTFEFAPVRVHDVVAGAVEAARDRFSAPTCQLEVEIAEDLPVLQGDRDALTTVVLNLLDNACKYTGDQKHVILRSYARDGQIVLEVQDNGIGIPRRAQRRVFDRFYQVDQSLSRRAGGCGLGLSIVRFIVAAHGGTVSVASQVGKGSVFTVRLPLRPRI